MVYLKIWEVMYNLGLLYCECLECNDKLVEILEQLNQCYFGSNYELDFWYVMYIVYKDLNNQLKVKEYFDKIVNKYLIINYVKIL